MADVKVFYCERSNVCEQRLRVYSDEGGECSAPSNYGYHQAIVALGRIEIPTFDDEDKYDPREVNTSILEDGKIGPIDANDWRWPTHCACGYKFDDKADKQYAPRRLFRRVDTGELLDIRNAAVGAMWHTGVHSFVGPDGQGLAVMLPGNHVWHVDSRARNCTSPCKHCGVEYQHHDQKKCTNPGQEGKAYTVGAYEDSVPEHRCWVRHGDPKTGTVHVDKQGLTCAAGAGSIIVPGYHGFLHNGHLTGVP